MVTLTSLLSAILNAGRQTHIINMLFHIRDFVGLGIKRTARMWWIQVHNLPKAATLIIQYSIEKVILIWTQT